MFPRGGGIASVVGIATSYGLEGPGIESRWGRHFPHPFWAALEPGQPPVNGYWAPFQGVKRPGCGVDHPPPTSVEVKERVVIPLLLPGPSWPVLGWNLHFLTFPDTNVSLFVLNFRRTYLTSSNLVNQNFSFKVIWLIKFLCWNPDFKHIRAIVMNVLRSRMYLSSQRFLRECTCYYSGQVTW